jgi:transposase
VPVSVVPSQRVRSHARSTGRLAATDRIDARLLSAYGRTHTPVPSLRPEPERQELKELVRARAQLLELKKMEASWAEHPPASALLEAQSEKRRAALDEQLEEVERAIRALVKAAPGRAQMERMEEVQGVGEVTAWTVWAEVPEIGQMAPGPTRRHRRPRAARPRQRSAPRQTFHPAGPTSGPPGPLHGRGHRLPA